MARDNAHMNNHAGMRFWTAITNAGKTKNGAVSIQTLLSLAELGGWEIVNGQSFASRTLNLPFLEEAPQLADEVSAS